MYDSTRTFETSDQLLKVVGHDEIHDSPECIPTVKYDSTLPKKYFPDTLDKPHRTRKTIVPKWAPAREANLPTEVQSLFAYRNSESEEAQALIAGGRIDQCR